MQLSAQQARACATLDARPAAATITAALPAVAAPIGRFLGTERVRIGRTRFDASWDRVSARRLSRRDVSRAIGNLPRDREDLLGQVNRWVTTKSVIAMTA